MSLIQEYTDLLTHIAEQYEDWSITAEHPFTISRKQEESILPLAISLYGSNSKAHLFINLYDNGTYTALAQKFLRHQQKEQDLQRDENSGLVIAIDEEGIAVIYDVTDVSADDFSSQFENIVETAESLLMKVIASSVEAVKDEPDTLSDPQEVGRSDHLADSKQSVEQVVKQYFAEKDYKFKHDKGNKRFIFGFSTDNYVNTEGEESLRVVINYSDDELLRFETPWLYRFDLNKIEYSLITMAIAWYQFEYKFLSMSLDPMDGELKISIDVPLGKGTIHTTQIRRIVSFILQFTEETYDELFSLLLSDSDAAKKKLNEMIDKYKTKLNSHRWVESIKDKLDGLTDEQKEAIEKILSQSQSTNEQGGI